MQILLIEPFFTGSHRQWAEGYRKFSRHQVRILQLPGRHWKWRMYGGAVSLARQFLQLDQLPDLILASDMLDLTTFLSLTRARSAGIPAIVYFHENQITYPWSAADEDTRLGRNNQYGFLNYTSALAADRVFFNSAYHRTSFLSALEPFLRQFPDQRELELIEQISEKSEVLPLGMDLHSLAQNPPAKRPEEPVIVWNHRWEYDKHPELFFQALTQLHNEGCAFKLIVMGEAFQKSPEIFSVAREKLSTHLLHFGYAPDRDAYARWLHLADIVPVSSRQDFFGGSVVEALYCNCHPLLPNRLAFPEHLPEAKRTEYLYDRESEFTGRLRMLLPQIDRIRSNTCYRDFVAHYDWRILAPVYDDSMMQLSKKRL
ncbi:MAG: DUF3524 domain-containing protein [Saprospiraceae bacterium]|nr:DUF3524 domain-containing protein [Lewinella sp.]